MLVRLLKSIAFSLFIILFGSVLLIACAPEQNEKELSAKGLSGLIGQPGTAVSKPAGLVFESYAASPASLLVLFSQISLPPIENIMEWKGKEDEARLSLKARYSGIYLNLVLKMMQALQSERYYLTDNAAFKGCNAFSINYDLQSQILDLTFTRDKGKKEWPDVLPAHIAYAAPVFPYGTYRTSEQKSLPNVENATLLVYSNVNNADLASYEKLLTDAGYVFDSEINGQRFFKRDTLFISLTPNESIKEVALIIGSYKVYYVALPPWPDPLPEDLKRILAPAHAVCSVAASAQGYDAVAKDLKLSEAFSFFSSMAKSYGWTELNEHNKMVNAVNGAELQVLSYNTQQNILTMHLTSQNEETSPPPSPSPSDTFRDEGFDDGLKDYNFSLTDGAYTEQEAMDGLLKEFGQTVVMADWNEIKSLYADRFDLFLNYVGVKPNEDVWLLYGKNGFDGKRHFFLARISGNPRSGFKKYDQVGDEAWLGSWYGIKLRVMVKAPDPLNPSN